MYQSIPVHTITRMTSGVGHSGVSHRVNLGLQLIMYLVDMVLELMKKDVFLPGSGYPQMIILIMLTKKIYMKASKINILIHL